MSQRVYIFDTTLRDGEQSPGCSMTVPEKLKMAAKLAELFRSVLEAGFPIASQGDFEAVEAVSREFNWMQVAALARCTKLDIDRAAEALKGAKRPRIHTFMATSDIHLQYKLKKSREQVLEDVVNSVRLARTYCDDVEFSAEDAARTDPDYLEQVSKAAVEAGARTINLPDTVGYSIPSEYAELIGRIAKALGDSAIVSVHCHDDLGLAVANSLAGVMAGARQIECTINGIGERAGNAALEEIVMAMRTRHDKMPFVNNIKTEMITRMSRTLATTVGFAVQPNKAIVGANAFAHESGIHQDGMLKNAATYEIMTPESVGLTKSELVLGKHSGRHALKSKIEEMGYELGDNAFQDFFKRFKDLADKKKTLFDDDIIALIEDEVATEHDRIQFVSLQVQAGTTGPQFARLELAIDGEHKSALVEGNGPVDAIFKAIRAIVPHENAKLLLYQVHAVTGGTDAQAEVSVRLEEDGKTVNGSGADADTLVASARAYVHALNKLITKRGRARPAA